MHQLQCGGRSVLELHALRAPVDWQGDQAGRARTRRNGGPARLKLGPQKRRGTLTIRALARAGARGPCARARQRACAAFRFRALARARSVSSCTGGRWRQRACVAGSASAARASESVSIARSAWQASPSRTRGGVLESGCFNVLARTLVTNSFVFEAEKIKSRTAPDTMQRGRGKSRK
jgi:hypothetical protein